MEITYPQLMTAAQKAESEQKDQPGEGVHARSTQAEGKGNIMRLSEQKIAAVSGSTEATDYHNQ